MLYYVFLGHKLQQAEIQLCKNVLMFEPIITRWFMLLLEPNYPMNRWVERDGCLDLHRYIYIYAYYIMYTYEMYIIYIIMYIYRHTRGIILSAPTSSPTTNHQPGFRTIPRLWPKATRAFLAVARAPELRQWTPRLAPENRQKTKLKPWKSLPPYKKRWFLLDDDKPLL